MLRRRLLMLVWLAIDESRDAATESNRMSTSRLSLLLAVRRYRRVSELGADRASAVAVENGPVP